MPSSWLSNTETPELQPIHALRQLYHPESAPYAFHANTLADALAWQQKTRPALLDAIGTLNLPAAPPDPRLLESVDCGDYIREKVLLRTSAYTLMPVYLLIPKGAIAPLPTVIAFHGHGYGVRDIVGLWEDGTERTTPDGYHKDFGVALCRRGFLVAAPEISCFGERHNDYTALAASGAPVPSTCHHTATLAFHLGGSAVGLRVADGFRLVDYLATRADVNINRLGAMGISGGGMHTFFSTCLDERIRACVISGYFAPFAQSIFGMDHCTCNYIPNLHRFGEIYDLAALIAPRPLLIEAATHDPIFPIQGVRQAFARAQKVYTLWEQPSPLELDEFEGRHQISGRRAYDFLWEALA